MRDNPESTDQEKSCPKPNRYPDRPYCARSREADRAFNVTMFSSFEFFRKLGIADLVGVKVDHGKHGTVLDFAFAEIMQVRPPMAVLLQIFRDAFGEKNVSRTPAIHHQLRNVHAGACDVR